MLTSNVIWVSDRIAGRLVTVRKNPTVRWKRNSKTGVVWVVFRESPFLGNLLVLTHLRRACSIGGSETDVGDPIFSIIVRATSGDCVEQLLHRWRWWP